MTHPIPDKALQQHIAVLGKTGSGKSYAVRGAVERLLDLESRVCVVDPTGAWNGLRSSASGTQAGYPVVIFGGNHADLPLGGAHGEAIAEVIGTSSTPSIIDTSLMKVGERTRFFTDFADAIVRKNKGPLHLVIDEAHLFMPQSKVNDPQSGAMMHAGNNMVSLGRSRGLRIILITQRPAKLHKDALTQAETLIAMRLIAPQDRAAVEAWIEDNADEAKAREIISSLATLKTGRGWIWAPELGVLERVTFPKIKTFDSGRAPDGSEAESAKVLAPIDREAIAQRLENVSASAMADDPKRLRARIAELERAAKGGKPVAPVDTAAIEQRGYQRGVQEAQRAAAMHTKTLRAALHQAVEGALTGTPISAPPGFTPSKTPVLTREKSAPAPRVTNSAADPSVGKGGKQRILVALAQHGRMAERRLGLLAGLSTKGGTWSTYLSALRQAGYIEGSADIEITADGLAALGSYDPLPTGDALIDYWRGRVGNGGRRAIFDALVEAYPQAVDQDVLAAAVNLSSAGGTWSTYLSTLRTMELITGKRELRASDELFN